ncbi:MAG TPA: hypothetical protein VI300_18525 [Solirubrobacter sp.]
MRIAAARCGSAVVAVVSAGAPAALCVLDHLIDLPLLRIDDVLSRRDASHIDGR